jgi:hypothetical protein
LGLRRFLWRFVCHAEAFMKAFVVLLFVCVSCFAAGGVSILGESVKQQFSFSSSLVTIGFYFVGIGFLYGAIYMIKGMVRENIRDQRAANRWRNDMARRNYYRQQNKFNRNSSWLRENDEHFRNWRKY